MVELIVLIVILVAVGFGLKYLPIDEGIKNLIRGLAIVFAVLLAILLILDLFGIFPNPIHLPRGK